MSEGNGEVSSKPAVVTITFDAAADKLHLDLECRSTDQALDMLARAVRHLEHRFRMEQLAQMQAQALEQQRAQAILESVRGRA